MGRTDVPGMLVVAGGDGSGQNRNGAGPIGEYMWFRPGSESPAIGNASEFAGRFVRNNTPVSMGLYHMGRFIYRVRLNPIQEIISNHALTRVFISRQYGCLGYTISHSNTALALGRGEGGKTQVLERSARGKTVGGVF